MSKGWLTSLGVPFTRRSRGGGGFVTLVSFVLIAAQGQRPPAKVVPSPRTAWGDPDLTGTYTSDNSIGVPFERPPQFAGRELLTDEEYAARDKTNDEQVAKDLGDVPEVPFAQDTAGNNAPRHWLDRPSKPSRATSLVVEPADGPPAPA